MKNTAALFLILTARILYAQPGADVPTLNARYQLMKEKAETYQDYKVIKTYVLDGIWKTAMDSIQASKQQLRHESMTIASLNGELKGAQLDLQEKESSMQKTLYAGSHIQVMGIDFGKKSFVLIVALVVLALLLVLGIFMGRLKLLTVAIREKMDLAERIGREFDEYKQKSMERLTKVSRELQNERNQLIELKRSH
jgi:uncharacterized membrane protein